MQLLWKYSRGIQKYTRNWEDESAYAKQTVQNRNPRPEDFPELGSKGERRNKSQHDREEKENKLRQNYQNVDDDNRNYPSQKRSLNRQMSDRRDGNDRRDGGDRRDSAPRQLDRYPSNAIILISICSSCNKIFISMH